MLFHSNKPKGFTLIEVIVVIGIISILTALLLANYHNGSGSSELQYVSQKLFSDLRKAQNMAMSSYGYEEGGVIEEVPCGYGVHFMSNSSYFLWRDLAQEELDIECVSSDKIYNIGEAIGVTITLPNNFNLRAQADDIFFMPPDPQVFFDGQELLGRADIEVWETGSENGKKIISVNKFGLIEIN